MEIRAFWVQQSYIVVRNVTEVFVFAAGKVNGHAVACSFLARLHGPVAGQYERGLVGGFAIDQI